MEHEEKEFPTSFCHEEKCYTNCPGHTLLDVANCSVEELFDELNKNKNLLNDFKKKTLSDYSIKVEEYDYGCHLHNVKNAKCALCNSKLYKTIFRVGVQSFILAEDSSKEAFHHCNLIKRSFVHAINNMLGVKDHIMFCIVCEKELESAFTNNTDPSATPSEATVWYSKGNYGSTIWDEEIYNERRLEAYICDKCLTSRANAIYTRISASDTKKEDIYLYGIKPSPGTNTRTGNGEFPPGFFENVCDKE